MVPSRFSQLRYAAVKTLNNRVNINSLKTRDVLTDLAPVHREKLDVAIVSVAEELTGDGLPGEVGVRVHVTTP